MLPENKHIVEMLIAERDILRDAMKDPTISTERFIGIVERLEQIRLKVAELSL